MLSPPGRPCEQDDLQDPAGAGGAGAYGYDAAGDVYADGGYGDGGYYDGEGDGGDDDHNIWGDGGGPEYEAADYAAQYGNGDGYPVADAGEADGYGDYAYDQGQGDWHGDEAAYDVDVVDDGRGESAYDRRAQGGYRDRDRGRGDAKWA